MVATTGSVYLLATGSRSRLEPAVAVSVDNNVDMPEVETPAAGMSPEIQQESEPRIEEIKPAPEPVEIRTTVDHTTPVKAYLEAAGLHSADASRWASLFTNQGHNHLLRRGHSLTLYKDPESGELRGLRYDIDDRVAVRERGLGGGVVIATRELIRYVAQSMQCAFTIKRDFAADAAKNGVPKPIVEKLADAFGSRAKPDGLRVGSAVKVIYSENVSRDGAHRLLGEIETAQLKEGRATLTAYGFHDEHGRAHLYDDQGKPLERQYLRFPLAFKYISSGFTSARYHPLLHRYRPHVGVDLVASYGAPVKAVSDGTVESAGWNGELGECVKITHEHGLSSVYAHLSRISGTARPGSFVRVGQVIGWVGSTGLSTGPHLHFAIFKNGSYVNPLTVKLEQNHEISPRMRAFFIEVKRRCQMALTKLPDVASNQAFASERDPASSETGDRRRTKNEEAARYQPHQSGRHYSNARATGSRMKRAGLSSNDWSSGFGTGGL